MKRADVKMVLSIPSIQRASCDGNPFHHFLENIDHISVNSYWVFHLSYQVISFSSLHEEITLVLQLSKLMLYFKHKHFNYEKNQNIFALQNDMISNETTSDLLQYGTCYLMCDIIQIK